MVSTYSLFDELGELDQMAKPILKQIKLVRLHLISDQFAREI